MGTNTSNLDLYKPAPTENWDVDTHFNANMQKIDDAFLPRRPVYKTITATTQSALDTALAEECASLAYGNFEVIELLGNWSGGTSPTSGARSLATIHRLNLSGAFYMCYVHFTGATGYYYSGAWHWDLGLPAIKSQITTATEVTLTAGSGITVPTGGIKCHKAGRVCYVTFNGLTFSGTGNFIISGLPSPISNVFAKPVSSNSTTTAAIVGNYAYMNTGATSMAISVASGNTNPHYICFCYITAS